ncbi:MAG: 50S ribosomal protein L23 [Alphaproteobacteria bacterium]|nr:50S ribosomal protein L23 [Alphaproteobacteria bacterium]
MENRAHNLGDLLSLIKYPLLTEKSINLYGINQYTFIVDRSLTKTEIKYIIERIFNVGILEVNTCIIPTKKRRVGRFIGKKSLYKKTYVKLRKGDFINDLLS